MKRVRLWSRLLLLAPLIAICGCGALNFNTGSTKLPTYTLSVSPQPASIPVNGEVTFTATTNDPHPNIFWGIVNEYSPNGNVDVGSPTTQTGGASFTYTAPSTPPIAENATIPAGSIAIRATDLTTTVQFNVAITTPSISTGFISTLNTVALGKTLVIWAYAVGSTNNAITMQVNGVTNGSSTYGTLAPATGVYGEYTYTAPATMPMTGNTVNVTVISQADPTKSSSMTVTLTAS